MVIHCVFHLDIKCIPTLIFVCTRWFWIKYICSPDGQNNSLLYCSGSGLQYYTGHCSSSSCYSCPFHAKSKQRVRVCFFLSLLVQSLIKFGTEERKLCHWKLDCLHYVKPHRWGMVKNPVPPMRQHIRQCVGQRSADYGSRQWLMTVSKIYITCRLCVSGVCRWCVGVLHA